MDLSKLSPEAQKYISGMLDRRDRDGVFDLDVCREILAYGKEAGSDAVYGIGCYFLAEHYWLEHMEEETMRYLAECTKLFLKEGMGDFLTRSYNLMGSVSDSQDNRLVSLNYFYVGLRYAEKYKLTYERGMINFNIGFVLFRMKRYEEAARYYENAINFYWKSEDSFYRSHNITMSIQHLGSCCLKIGQSQKAFSLLDKIDVLRKKNPDRNYPEINLLSFRAECAAAKGDRQAFLDYLSQVLEIIRGEEEIGEAADNLESLVELLALFEEYDKLDELFQVLEQKGLNDSPMLYMSLYPYRSESLLLRDRTEEYIAYTKTYFEAYEKDRKNHRLGVARIMELQDELHTVEQEQVKMSAANRRLEAIALYDSMTKLANRTRISEYTSQKFEEAQKEGSLLGVEIMDIDCFKNYNDTYGHLKGDKCIEAIAGVLRSMESDHIFCGRYGGDEFMVIYSGMTPQEIEHAVEEIQNKVRNLCIAHEKSACADIVTVSQGVFIRVPDSKSREWDFNSMADRILYEAKRNGRNCYQVGTEFS